MRLLLVTLSLLCCAVMRSAYGDGRPELESELIHEWHSLDYLWDKGHDRDDYIADGRFVPENLHISSIAVHDKWIYATIPRFKNATGIPWVLNRISTHEGFDHNYDKLRPWPKHGGQDLGDCTEIQNPMALDIDHDSLKLYVVDNGISLPGQNVCPPKIVVIDTKTEEKQVFSLGRSMYDPSGFMTSIVLDKTSHHAGSTVKYAYIAQAGSNRIVVYDFDHQRVSNVSHPTMSESDASPVSINGVDVPVDYGLISLALSPDFNYLYYISAGSHRLFQVPTWPLRLPGPNITINPREVGLLRSNSDAIFHGKDSLYFTVLEEDAVYRWESRNDMAEQGLSEGDVLMQTERLVNQNWETMQWPDSITLDDHGKLWVLSNKAHLFYNDALDFSDPTVSHYRMFREEVDDYSYLDSQMPHGDAVVG